MADQLNEKMLKEILVQGAYNAAVLSTLLGSMADLLAKQNNTSFETEHQMLSNTVDSKFDALLVSAAKNLGEKLG